MRTAGISSLVSRLALLAGAYWASVPSHVVSDWAASLWWVKLPQAFPDLGGRMQTLLFEREIKDVQLGFKMATVIVLQHARSLPSIPLRA